MRSRSLTHLVIWNGPVPIAFVSRSNFSWVPSHGSIHRKLPANLYARSGYGEPSFIVTVYLSGAAQDWIMLMSPRCWPRALTASSVQITSCDEIGRASCRGRVDVQVGG